MNFITRLLPVRTEFLEFTSALERARMYHQVEAAQLLMRRREEKKRIEALLQNVCLFDFTTQMSCS